MCGIIAELMPRQKSAGLGQGPWQAALSLRHHSQPEMRNKVSHSSKPALGPALPLQQAANWAKVQIQASEGVIIKTAR